MYNEKNESSKSNDASISLKIRLMNLDVRTSMSILKREGNISFTQCHVIVCIALKNKTIGFLKQNSNKGERDDSMKLKWTLSFNSLCRFRACVYRKKLKEHKISADFHYLLHQIKVF